MKKADMSLNTVVVIILMAVVAFFIGMIAYKAGQAAIKGTDDVTCLQSIENAALMKKLPAPALGDPYFALNCPRGETFIKKSDVVENDKVNQKKASSIIAEEMRRCWEKVGAGHIDPFSDWNGVKDQSICMICTRMRYDKSLINFMKEKATKYNSGGNSKGMQLSDFLITNPLPYLQETPVPGKRFTYFRYFFGSTPENPLTPEEKANLGTSIVDDNTLILVRMYKSDGREWITSRSLIIAGGVALVVIGIVTSPFTLGTSLSLTVAGVTLVSATTVVLATVAAGAVTAATIIAADASYNAFADCPDCKGQGYIVMVPSTINLYEKYIPYQDKDGNKENKALCDIIVN